MCYTLINADCFDWLRNAEPNSIHAVVTDPPYGLIEFSEKERATLKSGDRGGIWRIPPTINGSKREPLPRFTIMTQAEKAKLQSYMHDWAASVYRVLVPGAHVCIAGNPSLQYLIQAGLSAAGFEVRSAVMRLYTGFRGGDRPKLAEREFPEVSVTARGNYEPWMIFRKPISERTVADNLRRWGTGGLRRLSDDKPFPDVIRSARTPSVEAELASHPTIKPQHFLRIIVRAMLPLGEGVILDTFAGSGSTLAAAHAIGYESIGIELDSDYCAEANRVIPSLSSMYPSFRGESLLLPVELCRTAPAPPDRTNTSKQVSLL
jgi:site-specific DNA-methyltransferase (adenine-specific)